MVPRRRVPFGRLFCASLLIALPVHSQVIDDFDTDPREDPDWEFYEPEAPAEYVHDAGYFQVTIPAGVNLDTWTAADRGIQMRRSAFPEDFRLETRVRMVGSGNPDEPIFPPVDESYLANLMVYFSQFDMFHFGFQRGTNLVNQRVGNTVPRCDEFNDLDEVSLQIRKAGNNYTFSWRGTDDEDWLVVCERQAEEPPQYLGLVFKTWNPIITEPETFEFDYFKILENPAPEFSNFVPAEGENFHDAAEGFSFDVKAVAADATIEPEGIELVLNDVDVTGDLAVAGSPTQRSVTYNDLTEDTIYTAVVSAIDSAGNSASITHSFGTLSADGQEFVDDFDDDPLDTPGWSWYEPETPVDNVVDDGFLRVTIPPGINMDHWVAADRATMLRRAGMPEDFVVETRVRFVGSGDPNNPQFPPTVENYLANLIIQFSQYDLFYWGFQRGTNLAIQRTGNSVPRCDVNTRAEEVSLQVRKLGSEYTFSWRESDDERWIEVCTRVANEAPLFVGLMFKTWASLSLEQTFEFDYFKILEVPFEEPSVSVCEDGEADTAWVGFPYRRALDVRGFPEPNVEIIRGPDGLAYNPDERVLEGWTPSETGTVSLEIRATNSQGEQSVSREVEVSIPSPLHDDAFDDDPRDSPDWEFYEPQPGIAYSMTEDEDGNAWWRLDVPEAGEFGANFDHWTSADNAPQLRREVEEGEDFVIETRVRLDPAVAPPANDQFLGGLMIYYGEFDVLHWNIGQERAAGFQTRNLFLERSGINNIAQGNVDGMIDGRPVELRLERTCTDVQAYYRGDGDEEWSFAGTHTTSDEPIFVGLIMKTWGNGAAWSVEFDYFDRLSADAGPGEGRRFRRGDPDNSGSGNITDAISVLNHLFAGTTAPTCFEAADVNGDATVNIADPVYHLNFLFGSGPPPADPSGPDGTECGLDPDPATSLGCEEYTQC